jgi:hypothetical protein
MSDPTAAAVAGGSGVTSGSAGPGTPNAELIGSRYLIRFEEDTLRH